ncbi:uncharacterized protein B0T15DRAFT_519440 [Chaetomium strumarium]|uniref:Dienelactone hydrolase domain-containing protein n=1 Tax=Chaetomium strumarium TaxID=1170767 RepID=A0AAJ0H2T4_9PEZI|nr:hypothetical protein B0T15DRAFT_519440 [Chaetomium strumarium]
MLALNRLRLVVGRAANPAPSSVPLSRLGTYARRLSSVRELVQPNTSSARSYQNLSRTKPVAPPVAKMSTMPASHGHNEACCNIPPVVSTGYSAKGSYDEVNGMKTYVTGPADATKGIVMIYDIFGYFDQTVQGADILATSSDQKYKVFIPDWFKGEPCPIEWYPPNTPEKQEKLGAFFGKNPPPGVAQQLPDVVKALQAKNPSIKSWGIIGVSTPRALCFPCHPAFPSIPH